MAEDNWKHRSDGMRCRTCISFVAKETDAGLSPLGRCRKHAPTLGGWPAVFASDWCGDHKLDETKLGKVPAGSRGLAVLEILGIVWLAGVAIQLGIWGFTGKTRDCHYAQKPQAVQTVAVGKTRLVNYEDRICSCPWEKSDEGCDCVEVKR